MRAPHLASVAAALLFVAALPASAASTPRPLQLDDLARLRNVSDPQISPDGAWVAYTVGTMDLEKDTRDSDVWMTSWDGSQQIRMTTSKDAESHPRWSPDGKYLAFLASRGDEAEKKLGGQVWLLHRAGGEAERLTDLPGGVDDFAWSPDGRKLVLVADDPNPADEPEKMEGWKRKAKPPIVIDRYAFKSDASGYLQHFRSHLYLFDLDSKKAEQVTSGDYDDRLPAWSPDGMKLAFVSVRAPADPDRDPDSDVYVVDAKAGASPVQITTYKGYDNGPLAWSPDGQWIAYLEGDATRFYAYNLNKLAVVPAAGGAPRILTAALDRAVQHPVFAPDGKSIYLTVEDDRAQYLARVPLAGGPVEPLTQGRRVVDAFSIAHGGRIAVLESTDGIPSRVDALDGGRLRPLSLQNVWVDELALAKVEDVTFDAPDGTKVDGLLTTPAGAAPGAKLPLLLWIHGGPDAQSDHSFYFDRELFAAHGYAVLQVNYRGSSGRGSAYQKAIYADWGHLEVMDLLAGVDWAVKQGIADPERLGIGGWSYGGILTDYTIATAPDRFKVAFSGAGSALQLSMYGIDQYIYQWDTEVGQPWKAEALYLKLSYPFFHADRIKTPTLFMGGALDFNVPLVGGEQMYEALRSCGVETQLVIYPGQHHGIRLPSYVRDRLVRWLAWYDQHLMPATKTPQAAKPQ